MLGLAIFNSCEEKGEFGIATDDVAPVEFSTVDVPVGASMVLMDSIITSNISIALFGQLNNSPFGNPVLATGYMGLSANVVNQPEIPDEATLDSVQINFRMGYLFDTLTTNRELNLELYPITETFYDTTYINSNSLTIGDELLANGQFQIDDFDSVYTLNVTENWVTDFFEGIRFEDENFTSQEKFEQYFPGIAFRTTTGNNNIFGMQTDSNFKIVFYYSQPNDDNTDRVSKTFEMSGTSMPNFFNVQVERAGTEFASVVDVNTEYGGTNVLGVHSGEGLVTKLDFKEIESFLDDNPNVIINLAELTIGPITDFPDGQVPPIGLIFYLTDGENTRIPDRSTFRAIQEDGRSPLGSGNPVRLFYNSETKSYVGSLTGYVKAFKEGTFKRSQFLMYPSEMNSSLKGFTLSRENLKLKIFYSEVN